MIRILAILFSLHLAADLLAADGRSDEGPRIRVAIARGSPALKLKTSSRIYVLEVKTGKKFLLVENAAYDITAAGEDVQVAGQ